MLLDMEALSKSDSMEFLTYQHIENGQTGFADALYKNKLIDGNGSKGYICTDSSRKVFRYKDLSGKTIKDLNALKLIECSIQGFNKHIKSIDAHVKTAKAEQAQKLGDPKLYETLTKSYYTGRDEIKTLPHNSSKFVKQLGALSVV